MDRAQFDAASALGDSHLLPFRVSLEAQAQIALMGAGELHQVSSEIRWGELSGRLRAAQQENPWLRPAVGDFVLARPSPAPNGHWRIEHLLPRRTRFVRQSVRRRLDPQVIAANVDVVLIVTTPNDDFNVRRLERYLTTVHASGAEPAIALNKSDLASDLSAWLDPIHAIAIDAPVISTQALSGEGLSEVRALVGPGRTLAVVGSSGVGKSSLINRLLGQERQAVGAIRSSDSKGRHTTTHRVLLPLPSEAEAPSHGLLIDTPGMRALSLWVDPLAVGEAFADIDRMGDTCRFRDCRHEAEPDCAVREAVDRGELSAGRLSSFRRLRKEVEEQNERERTRRKKPKGRG